MLCCPLRGIKEHLFIWSFQLQKKSEIGLDQGILGNGPSTSDSNFLLKGNTVSIGTALQY